MISTAGVAPGLRALMRGGPHSESSSQAHGGSCTPASALPKRRSAVELHGQSGWGDSHSRPLVPQTSALLTALHPGFFLLLFLSHASSLCSPVPIAQFGRLLLDLDQPLLDRFAADSAAVIFAEHVEWDLGLLLVLGTPPRYSRLELHQGHQLRRLASSLLDYGSEKPDPGFAPEALSLQKTSCLDLRQIGPAGLAPACSGLEDRRLSARATDPRLTPAGIAPATFALGERCSIC